MSLKELELINPQNIKFFSDEIMTFETNTPKLLSILGGIIKRGIIIDNSKQGSLEVFLQKELENSDKRLVGINNLKLGKELKRELGFKRFKLTKVGSTDRDIKKKGIEIVVMGGKFGLIKGYQNIALYEEVDFKKPSRSMQMGMMPAKLTHIMLNIGLAMLQDSPGGKGVFNSSPQENPQPPLLKGALIYDPFAGSGTTGFIADYFGYDFILSDKDIFHLHKNIQWRRKHPLFKNSHNYYFEHDIRDKLDISIIQKVKPKQILIITEGWLGPIVKSDTSLDQVEEYQQQVIALYELFLDTILQIAKHITIKAIFTIPYYLISGTEKINKVESALQAYGRNHGLELKSIDEIYKREGQKVGRKIMMIE